MDLDRLKLIVPPTVDLDVTGTYAEFHDQTGDSDTDAFLSWLLDRGMIDEQTFCTLHGQEDIELADLLDLTRDPNRTRFNRLGEVGKGAMGVVHVAQDADLRRKVAYKSMLHAGAIHLRRFLDEAQITAQLDHPGVVPVYSLEISEDGKPAYSMKLVHGKTLAQLLEATRLQIEDRGAPSEKLSLQSRLDLFLKVCEAIAYAHVKGVIHRDLKPDNVMVGKFGAVYVMDWGLARLVDAEGEETVDLESVDTEDEADGSISRTRVGSVLGTPAYMSPEQASGELDQLSPASDQFSLGLILYELIYLKRAWHGTMNEVLEQAVQGAVHLPDEVPNEPPGSALVAILRKATATKPDDRYLSVEAFADDIRRYLHGEETLALPDTPIRRARRWMVRHQRTTFLGISVLLVASALVAAGSWVRQEMAIAEERVEAQARTQVLTDRAAEVSARANLIDRHFQYYEGLLEGLATAAIYAFEHGTPQPIDQTWSAADYRDPATAPPNMVYSEHYKRMVSPDYPVYKEAPGVPEERWAADLAILDGLRPYLRRMFLVRPDDQRVPQDPDTQRERIAGHGVSMEWAYVAMEEAGLIYMFPGAKGWDDKYDARDRPWYRDAVGTRGKTWGKPYVDLMGQGRLVSCVTALYDKDDTFIGVAGVDLQFEYLLDNYLALDEFPGFRAAYLLLPDGQVMLQTTAADDPVIIPPTDAVQEGIDFGVFTVPEVVEGAKTGRSGYLVEDDQLWVWWPMRHLGWTYAVSADPEAALAGE